MPTRSSTWRRVIPLVMVVAVTLGATSASAAGIRPQRVHSVTTFQYLNAGPVTYVGDRGQLTAVDPSTSTLSMTRDDGVPLTLVLSSTVCVRVDGLPAALTNLVTGQDLVVVSDASGTTALAIRAGHPVRLASEPGCGLVRNAFHADQTLTMTDGTIQDRSWDRGRISGLAPGWIRILRVDGGSVTSHRTWYTRVEGAASYWRIHLGERVAVVSLMTTDAQGHPVLSALVIRRHIG